MEVKYMAALSKKGVTEIVDAIRALGGETTVAKLAERLGRHVNGMSQTLSNNKKLIGIVELGDGKGGARIVRIPTTPRSLGPLFDPRPE